MNDQTRLGFWQEVFSRQGSVGPRVLPLVLTFGMVSAAICGLVLLGEYLFERRLVLALTPHELAGAALSLLLVLRTNAGYDRWWEARKLWGGFVDRTRNLVISALAFGPDNAAWREKIVRWTAAYPIIAALTLRNEKTSPDLVRLLGEADAGAVLRSDNMPAFVALRLAELLRQACDDYGTDRFAFLQMDHERALLVTNYGGCERIVNTPLPRVYSTEIRRLITLFLATLPFVTMHRLDSDWLVPVVTMLVAYPMLALDQMGIELENPFARENLSHLALAEMSSTIEQNLFALLRTKGQ